MKSILISLSILTIITFSLNKKAYTQQDTITLSPDIQLIKLSDNVFIHKSYTNASFGRFSSNGLIILKNGKALMIDTPMTNDDTERIYSHLTKHYKSTIEVLIGCHSHNDCIGGMPFLQSKGVKTISGSLTKKKCLEQNLSIPEITFEDSYLGEFEGIKYECAYFGGGHTEDNIVVYFPTQKILFGGCLIKSLNSTNMGNISEATPQTWATTVSKAKERFHDAEIVVPGHGNYGGIQLLDFTIELANKSFGTKN